MLKTHACYYFWIKKLNPKKLDGCKNINIMTDWKEIHPDFVKIGDTGIYGGGLTYQQLWESKGFTKEEA